MAAPKLTPIVNKLPYTYTQTQMKYSRDFPFRANNSTPEQQQQQQHTKEMKNHKHNICLKVRDFMHGSSSFFSICARP